MLHDLKSDPDRVFSDRYDVCIAGGGVAGIALALRLHGQGKRVLLLEGGGRDYSQDSQDCYRGSVVGKAYYDLEITRLRHLGGTSNHWAGYLRPLEAHDFERTESIAGSGWPIAHGDLRPFEDETCDFFGIERYSALERPSTLPDDKGHLREIRFQNRFQQVGEDNLPALRDAAGIDLVLNANAVDLTLEGDRITGLTYRSYPPFDQAREARADAYVLAMGGLENPRFLLNCTRQRPMGIGNEYDQVGRYFQEHPHYTAGIYMIDPTASTLGRERRFLQTTRSFIRREGIGIGSLTCEVIDNLEERSRTWREFSQDVICASDTLSNVYTSLRPAAWNNEDNTKPWFCTPQLAENVPNAGILYGITQQVPNASSRVSLGEERDVFGQRRIALDWQLTEQDHRTFAATALEFGRYLARTDQGRVRLQDWVNRGHAMPDVSDGEKAGGFHHMGTTRMGGSPRDGVVDQDCKVFGTDNLYIAGSSVFRTAGHANPTFTLTQLAFRLADHLARG